MSQLLESHLLVRALLNMDLWMGMHVCPVSVDHICNGCTEHTALPPRINKPSLRVNDYYYILCT